MTPTRLEVCILAAGMGTRMKSSRPKVLQPLAGRPMLAHLLEAVSTLSPAAIHVVIGQGAEQVRAAFPEHDVNWVLQAEQLGTGHAVMQAMPDVKDDARLLVLLGDAPLVLPATLAALADADADLTVLTVNQPDPFNYGRIIRDGDRLLQIIEEKDATDTQKQIHEVNTGVMAASAGLMKKWLQALDTRNSQQEYLLTDIVGIANETGARVTGVVSDDPSEVQGVNHFGQLAMLERYCQRRTADSLMVAGVHLVDPDRLTVRGSVVAGRDVSIDINCIFEGDVELADGVTIGANCIVKDSRIGEATVIKPNTMLDGALVAENCTVGPYARIRPGTELARRVAIGNFVEVKKSSIGEGSKASHLSYLGDATLGSGVNIGAGTITCNYDGVAKWPTRIEDGVFVGSNSALVAPVTLGKGSTIAAGSSITRSVEPRSLGVARGRQKNLENWKGPRDA